jgi:isopenicillin-N N-acyltransferase like protein
MQKPTVTRYFRSTETEPHARGLEFGKTHADRIRSNISLYQNLFSRNANKTVDIVGAGNTALEKTKSFAPALHCEMLGMAEGANIDPALIGMLNARTEILGMLNAGTRGECSTVIHVATDEAPPVAAQTWDWFYELRDSWLLWEIPLADGSTTKTMTEYGIVGKSGMNTRGLGVLFTILHHINDGHSMGVPVHVISRWLMDSAPTIAHAAKLAASANVSASSSLNLVSYENGVSSAITVELHPGGPAFVLPQANGFLIHTNHFLAPDLKCFDTQPKANPDTLLRFDLLTRRAAALQNITAAAVLKIMASHSGASDAVCCHHNPATEIAAQYETLSTVVIDLVKQTLDVHAGGPCTHPLVK